MLSVTAVTRNVTSAHCGFNVSTQLHVWKYVLLTFDGSFTLPESEMNRKVLADLAVNHPEAFKAIVAKVK